MVPTFQNPILLWFIPLALIPLLIHLLIRWRLRVIRWAAFEILLEVLREQKKRIRYRELIMLLLRTAVLLLLVLMLARPALRHRPTNLLGPERRSVVILLDNSYSMGQDVLGRPAFDDAQHKALRILDGLEPGSEVCVYLMNRLPVPVVAEPTRDLSLCRRQLLKVRLSHETTRPAAALRTAEALLKRMTLEKSCVYVISDFQASAWASEEVVDALRLLARSSYVELLPAAAPTKGNIVVEDLASEGEVLLVDRAATLMCVLANSGRDSAPAVVVSLYDGDAKVSSAMVREIGPGAIEKVYLPIRPEAGGMHSYSARVGADVLDLDNERRLAAEVHAGGLPVLVVDGGARGEGLLEESVFIRRALAPREAGGGSGLDPYVLTTVHGDVPVGTRWDDFRAVIFADPAEPPRNLAGRAQGYLEEGGVVIIFVGERAVEHLSAYDDLFGPAWPVDLKEVKGEIGKDGGEAMHLSPLSITGDALSFFRRKPEYGLLFAEPSFFRYPILQLKEDAGGARALASFKDQSPAIVENTAADGGRLFVFAADAQLGEAAWNNWAASPSFLITLRRLLDQAVVSRDASRRNRMVGDTGEVLFPGIGVDKVRVHRPDDSIEEVLPTRKGNASIVQVPLFDKAGFYTYEPMPGTADEVMAVNLRTGEESQLEPVDLEKLAGISARISVWGTADVVAEKVLAQTRGYEFWRTLLFLLALMVAAEMVLALLWSPARGWRMDEMVGGLTLRAPGAAGKLIEELGREAAEKR